jgi:hypothetical protein
VAFRWIVELAISLPMTANAKNPMIVLWAAPRAVAEGLPPKPKGMHRTTYQKLARRFLGLESAMGTIWFQPVIDQRPFRNTINSRFPK